MEASKKIIEEIEKNQKILNKNIYYINFLGDTLQEHKNYCLKRGYFSKFVIFQKIIKINTILIKVDLKGFFEVETDGEKIVKNDLIKSIKNIILNNTKLKSNF